MKLNDIRDDRGLLPSYAWPGGYQIIYHTKDGGIICPECANREVDASQEVIAYDVFYEGAPLNCDDCNTLIESAYGDPEEPEE